MRKDDAGSNQGGGRRHGHRHRSGHHELRGGDPLGPEALDRDGARRRHPAVVRGARRCRHCHRRTPGPPAGGGRPRADRPFGQAPDGLRDARADGAGSLRPAGDFGLHSQGAQGAGGPRARPGRAEGSHYRPGVLHRRPAAGHTRGRGDRRPDGRPDHQRTNGRRPQLRGWRHGEPHPAHLRHGRRHLRRLGGAHGGGRGRSPGHRRRQPARRRRLRRAPPRAPQRAHRNGVGGRGCPRRSPAAGAPAAGRRAGQDRAVGSALRARRGGPRRPGVRRGQAPHLRVEPRRFRNATSSRFSTAPSRR